MSRFPGIDPDFGNKTTPELIFYYQNPLTRELWDIITFKIFCLESYELLLNKVLAGQDKKSNRFCCFEFEQYVRKYLSMLVQPVRHRFRHLNYSIVLILESFWTAKILNLIYCYGHYNWWHYTIKVDSNKIKIYSDLSKSKSRRISEQHWMMFLEREARYDKLQNMIHLMKLLLHHTLECHI